MKNKPHTEQAFRPKRQLGQNFLIDPNILRIILKSAQPLKERTVFEVGPGTGTLTKALLEEGARVVAVETDPTLSERLRGEIGKSEGLTLIEGDVLKLNLKDLFKEHKIEKVVSNLPYKITSPLLYEIAQLPALPEELVLMVQWETARRISARWGEKDYSALGILLSLSYQVTIVHRVSPQAFRPRPKVESAIVKLRLKNNPAPPSLRTAAKEVLAWGFSHPRKMVAKSLSLGNPKVDWRRLLKKCGIDPQKRPHQLKEEEWVVLSEHWLNSHTGD